MRYYKESTIASTIPAATTRRQALSNRQHTTNHQSKYEKKRSQNSDHYDNDDADTLELDDPSDVDDDDERPLTYDNEDGRSSPSSTRFSPSSASSCSDANETNEDGTLNSDKKDVKKTTPGRRIGGGGEKGRGTVNHICGTHVVRFD